MPGGLKDERDGGGFFEREIFGIRQAVNFGDADEFGAAAVDHVAEVGGLAASVVEAGNASCAFAAADQGSEHYFLTYVNGGDFRANPGDFSCDVAAGNVGKRDGNAGEAAAHPEIEMIEGTGSHADENFAGVRFGFGDIGVSQNFGSPMLAEKDDLHSSSGLL